MTPAEMGGQEELIGLIYDAAASPAAWQSFLDRLVTHAHACSGLLVLQDTGSLDIAYTVQSGFDAATRERYNRDYRVHDLWTRSLSRMARGQVFPTRAMVDPETFHHSLIYHEFCRPLGVEHGAGAFIPTDDQWSIRLALQRGKTKGEFRPAEVDRLQRLVPHIQRSIRLGRQLGSFREGFEAAIERLTTPCVIVGVAGKVVTRSTVAHGTGSPKTTPISTSARSASASRAPRSRGSSRC